MKKSGNILLSLVFLVSLIAVMSFVSAGNIANITLITPATSGTVGGTYMLNASYNGTDSSNVTCQFYAKSASTANSSWSLLGSEINRTYSGGLSVCNLTVSLNNKIEDSNDYMFNVTIINSTNKGSVVNTGITTDYTIPQAPSSLTPIDKNLLTSSGTQTFSSTVTDFNTTLCTYAISRGGASSGDDYLTGSATYSASTCSFTKAFSTTADNGDWVWSITASDGTNTTSSITNTLTTALVGAGGSGSQVVVPTGQNISSSGSSQSPIMPIVIILVIVVIIVAIRRK